jgi:membrane-associated phospholipid phosphatase
VQKAITPKLLLIGFIVCFLPIRVISQQADIQLLRYLNSNHNASADPMFKTITNSVFPLAFALPTVVSCLHLLKKDSANKQRAIIIGGTLIISSAVTGILKYSIQRERPFVTYPDVKHITPEDSYSFPSGHTSTAFALAVAAADCASLAASAALAASASAIFTSSCVGPAAPDAPGGTDAAPSPSPAGPGTTPASGHGGQGGHPPVPPVGPVGPVIPGISFPC